MRWYGAVDLALACKRCCPRLYGWLERAQTRLGSYGPDGAARSASAGSADNMLFTLGAEGPALGGSSGRRAQRHRSRVLRGAPTTPSSSSAAAALGLMPGPPGQPFGGSDFVASGGGAVAPQVRHAGAAGGEWRPPLHEPSQPHTPQGGGGCSGGFTTGSAGAAEASPAGRKAGSAKSRASSKLERRRAAAREQAAKEHPPLSALETAFAAYTAAAAAEQAAEATLEAAEATLEAALRALEKKGGEANPPARVAAGKLLLEASLPINEAPATLVPQRSSRRHSPLVLLCSGHTP